MIFNLVKLQRDENENGEERELVRNGKIVLHLQRIAGCTTRNVRQEKKESSLFASSPLRLLAGGYFPAFALMFVDGMPFQFVSFPLLNAFVTKVGCAVGGPLVIRTVAGDPDWRVFL
jgi:hypothetical protein